MKYLALSLLFLWSIVPGSAAERDGIRIVPRPAAVEELPGSFRLTSRMRIVVGDERLRSIAEILARAVETQTGLSPVVAAEPDGPAVTLRLDPGFETEEYRLEVTKRGAVVSASTPQGVLHGVRSLQQLIADGEVPACIVRDKPCFAYRGAMLDVCRHFFPVEEVKTFIDLRSLHKINRFHWHLTDDQGWRIEIRKYPELTRVGAVRKRTLVGRDPGGEYDETCRYDETPYGGFYTQEEIREVVDYAARRFITVIPEIEFPGHAVAALASYPWLGCTGERYEVRQTWDIDDRVFCPGRETTFEFMEGVLEEVLELFPSEYIHIGGDECPTKMWERCPACRARMVAEGLTRPRQLQGYATARIERFLLERGRRLIGWDEMLDGGVTPTAVVMSWRGTEGGVRAARQGNEVVMAPTTHCYFDYYQTADTVGEPLAWGGCLPVEQVYSLDPLEGLSADERRFVRGVQANLWTEYIADFEQAQYMLLPRLSALAEVAWSLDRKDVAGYRSRAERLRWLYDACGYRYARHLFAD